MNALTLNFPKMKFVLPELTELGRIGTDAESRLGYSGLTANVDEMKLLAILSQLDILPFEQEAVDSYQKKERAKTGTFGIAFFSNYNWYDTNLSSYSGVVPISALKMALRIKEVTKGIDITFKVNYLSQQARSHRVEDPFLSVQVGHHGKSYYIAVWDEPNFQG